MKNKAKQRKTISYWLVAFVIFCALFLVFGVALRENRAVNSAELVFLGDSIFAQERGDTSIPALVAEGLDTQGMINCSFGGTMLSRGKSDAERAGEDVGVTESSKTLLSMVALTHAMAGEDFGAQQTLTSREAALIYLSYTIDIMEQIDFHKVGTLIFNHGLNDYHNGVKLDNPEDPYDEHTYGGALRTCLSILQQEYPQLRIIFVTPSYTWYLLEQKNCEEMDFGQGTLDEYVELAIRICGEYGVEVVDVFHGLYENEGMDSSWTYGTDGIHPNEHARRLIAQEIVDHLGE